MPWRGRRATDPYEVFGERYTVMASAEGYVQRGIASWYGREFAGRPTSSGEIFDPEQLTAAHRSLPLSTWVEEDGGWKIAYENPLGGQKLRLLESFKSAVTTKGAGS